MRGGVMQCARGHANAIGARFCISCGIPLAEEAPLAADTAPIDAGMPNGSAPRGSRRPVLIAAGSVAIVVALLAGIGIVASRGSGSEPPSATATASSEPSASPSATKAAYVDLLTDPAKIVVPGQCEELESVVDRWATTAKEALASSKKATKDAWAAASYEADHPWVGTAPDDEFAGEIEAINGPALDTLTGGQGDLVRDAGTYVTDVMRECQILADYDDTESKVGDMAARGRAIAADAASKPWYPKGYIEYVGADGIAWRWLDNDQFNCDYYYATCWGMSIVAEDGCPSGLYAEIDILDSSGDKISYSNDLESYAAPGDKVRLIFNDFSDGIDSARLADINCY